MAATRRADPHCDGEQAGRAADAALESKIEGGPGERPASLRHGVLINNGALMASTRCTPSQVFTVLVIPDSSGLHRLALQIIPPPPKK